MIDLVFVCDATTATGFGHAARCTSIAAAIRQRRSDLSIGFLGAFTERAVGFLGSRLPDADILPSDDPGPFGVAIVDRMADPQDADAWDAGLLQRLREQCRHVVHIASGTTPPDMTEDMAEHVTVIGYQPIADAPKRPNIYWDLKYAPVEIEAKPGLAVRPDVAFVAVGGGDSAQCLTLALDTLAAINRFKTARVLVSPVWSDDAVAAAAADYPGIKIERLENLPDLSAKIGESAVVIATQGNLAYQAIALGRPTVLLAIKAFQADIARRLQAATLCRFAGLAAGLAPADLARTIEAALAGAEAMTKTAAASLDGQGIERLADLVLRRYERALARS